MTELISYPYFKSHDIESFFIHFISHGRVDVQRYGNTERCIDCMWCSVDNDAVDIPLTVDGCDMRLHKRCVGLILYPVVSLLIRMLFNDVHQQCDGSNTALLMKGRLSKQQCLEILRDWDEEGEVCTEEEYEHSCNEKMRKLFTSAGIPIASIISTNCKDLEDYNESDFIGKHLELVTRVGQYAPIVQKMTVYRTLMSRLVRLNILSKDNNLVLRLPNPALLTISDKAFVLYCLYRQGLVALSPAHVLHGISSIIHTDVISYLMQYNSTIAQDHCEREIVLELKKMLEEFEQLDSSTGTIV